MSKVLIVVDFQVDFVDGSLGFKEAPALDNLLNERINKARKENEDVIFTFDTHQVDYLKTMEGKKLPVEHCIKGTKGHDLYGKVAKNCLPSDKLIYKPTFGSLELGNYLQEKEYSTVELCGLVTNICILSNAVIAKAALPEADIIVNSKLVSSFDKNLHDKTLEVLKSIHIDII